MSVIIIGAGGDGVKAINDLTTASTMMTPEQRDEAEQLIARFINDINTLIDRAQNNALS